MRRLVFVIIGIILTGKILATVLVGLVPASVNNEIVHTLAVDQWTPAPHRQAEDVRPVLKNGPAIPLKLSIPVAQLKAETPAVEKPAVKKEDSSKAQAEKKKQEQEKKEKERRKKRKKKLEELANKKLQQKPSFVVQTNSDPAQDRSGVSGFSGGPVSYLVNRDIRPAPPAVNPAAGTTPKNPVNLTDLTNRLVNRPSLALMKTLQGLLQSGQITTKQYYQVIAAMQKSKIPDARKLAVSALAGQPSSQAFQILADEKHTETVPDILGAADVTLQTYRDVKYLNILSMELSFGDLFAKIEASDMVAQIAKSYMAGQPATNQIPSKVQDLFRPFINLLNPLAQDPSQPSLRIAAEAALLNVNTIIGVKS